MTGKGRPLRFLTGVGLSWFALRVVMLWPEAPAREAPAVPPRVARPRFLPPIAQAAPPKHRRAASARAIPRRQAASVPSQARAAQVAPLPEVPTVAALAWPGLATGAIRPPDASRWSGSGWIVARGGKGLGAAPGAGQLGGGQAGLRIAYALTPRLALTARATAPLEGKGREVALGAQWQPGAAPLRLIAEQRFALEGGAGGPALGAIAGLYRPLPGAFRLEAYGQAGAVARTRIEPYADGAARLSRDLTSSRAVSLDIGVGAWGAAQREAARLDLGISVGLRLPRLAHGTRLMLDWRERVAGDARPGSGAVVTLGSDF